MKIKELESKYNEQASKRKQAIRNDPNKFRRFWRWVLFVATFPFVWSWYNFRDWRTFVIFLIVMAVVGIEVWLPLLLGLIFKNAWLLGVAAICELFWLSPGTPFLPLCIFITIGIKALFNKLEKKRGINK